MAQHRMVVRRKHAGTHNQQSYPYFSRVRFQFAVTAAGGPPATTTVAMAAGSEVKAFNYAQGQSLAGAGFGGSLNATPLETNLIKQSETVAGENVKIYGISFLLDTDSDAELLRLIFANTSVRLGMNGDQQVYQLGPLHMLPGGGGLHGMGRTDQVEPDLTSRFALVGAMQNGLPGAANFFRLPTPIFWRPPGGADATLVITARVERAISFTSLNRVVQAAGANTTGAQAYTAPVGTLASTPNTLGTYCGGWFVLHSVTKAPRSQNA